MLRASIKPLEERSDVAVDDALGALHAFPLAVERSPSHASRNVTLNSSSGITSKKVTLVAWTATFNSSATWEVDPVPQEDLRMYDNHVALMQ